MTEIKMVAMFVFVLAIVARLGWEVGGHMHDLAMHTSLYMIGR